MKKIKKIKKFFKNLFSYSDEVAILWPESGSRTSILTSFCSPQRFTSFCPHGVFYFPLQLRIQAGISSSQNPWKLLSELYEPVLHFQDDEDMQVASLSSVEIAEYMESLLCTTMLVDTPSMQSRDTLKTRNRQYSKQILQQIR